ncbi:endonuclease [Vibrio phage F99]|nr:hypothetical protein MYOV085v1_p0073 [Vibrio phage 355E48.1]
MVIPESEWTKLQLEFAGTTFKVEKTGATLTVTGISGKSKNYTTVFRVECSVCSKDTELFPEGFNCRKGSLQNKDGSLNKIPCGCSNSPRWTDRQDEIHTQRILDETQPNLKVVGSERVKGRGREFILECAVCSKDKGLWPKGSINSIKSSLVNRQIPCGCSKKPEWSEDQFKTLVQRECNQRAYIFHGWGGDFKSAHTKLDLENPVTGNRWQSNSINNFLNLGSGDPYFGSGYSTELDGRLYLVEWFGFGESYLKKGITNKETLTRIKQQYSKSKLDYRIIREIHSEDGQLIADLEKFLNIRFDGSQCSKELLPDGWTETVENTPEVYRELNAWFDKFEDVVSGKLKLEDVIKKET